MADYGLRVTTDSGFTYKLNDFIPVAFIEKYTLSSSTVRYYPNLVGKSANVVVTLLYGVFNYQDGPGGEVSWSWNSNTAKLTFTVSGGTLQANTVFAYVSARF